MAHADTCPIFFTYPPVASMQVVTVHNLFLYSDPPLTCHPFLLVQATFEPNLNISQTYSNRSWWPATSTRLNTRRGKPLHDYADVNYCLIFGPDTSTTNPYNTSGTPDVLDIVIT